MAQDDTSSQDNATHNQDQDIDLREDRDMLAGDSQ